jgi:hypothetical protein
VISGEGKSINVVTDNGARSVEDMQKLMDDPDKMDAYAQANGPGGSEAVREGEQTVEPCLILRECLFTRSQRDNARGSRRRAGRRSTTAGEATGCGGGDRRPVAYLAGEQPTTRLKAALKARADW